MVKKILLAEDDADIRFILQFVLAKAGYDVEPISTGHNIVEGKHVPIFSSWTKPFLLLMVLPSASTSRSKKRPGTFPSS